jgi:hypothetical protein
VDNCKVDVEKQKAFSMLDIKLITFAAENDLEAWNQN